MAALRPVDIRYIWGENALAVPLQSIEKTRRPFATFFQLVWVNSAKKLKRIPRLAILSLRLCNRCRPIDGIVYVRFRSLLKIGRRQLGLLKAASEILFESFRIRHQPSLHA